MLSEQHNYRERAVRADGFGLRLAGMLGACARGVAPLRLIVVVGACVAAGFEHTPAQNLDRIKPASATLPESNEGLLLVNAAEEAIRAGDFRLALEQIDRLMRLRGELVGGSASRTYVPVWREGVRLLTPLPPEATRLYRDLYDAEVSTRFEQARARGALGELEELFRVYRLSSAWPAVGVELAGRLLDAGVFGRALEVLQELAREAAPADLPEIQLRLAAAYALSGSPEQARTVLAAMHERGDPAAPQPRVAALREWLASRAVAPSAARVDFELRPIWAQALPVSSAVQRGDDEVLDAIDVLRRLPIYEPLVTPDDLIVRLRGRLSVLDAHTLSVRWTAQERLTEAPAAEPDAGADTGIAISRDTELLLQHHLRHTVGAGFGLVFTIEGGRIDPRRRNVTFTVEERGRNELVARDLASGALRWRTGDDASDPLYDVEFQDRPLALGERLLAVFQRAGEVRVAEIDPQTGKSRGETPVVGLPTHFDAKGYGGRCLLAADETTVFVCTGNGVIAALERDPLAWKWATVYASTLARHLGRLWWQPPESPVESGVDRPLLSGDLMIVAPQDSTDIFALDRFSGQERWRIERREYSFVVGATEGGMIVGGPYLASLDLSDPLGKPLRWKSVPLEISGRPALAGGRIYAPTRGGIVVVDARTGKVVAEEERAGAIGGRAQSANLVAGADALFQVSTRDVTKFPSIPALRRTAARLRDERADAGRADVIDGWADVFESAPQAALTRLERAPAPDAALARARAALLLRVFEQLAAGTERAERLEWLRRAGEIAEGAGGAGALSVPLGQQIEQAAGPDEALRFYLARLGRDEDAQLHDPDDPARQVAAWLHAAQRIGALLPGLEAEAAKAHTTRAIADALGSAQPGKSLHRLFVAVRATAFAGDVALAALSQQLAPELATEYLRAIDDARLTAAQRRFVALTRWETQLSLGKLEAAVEAQQIRLALPPQQGGDEPAADDARVAALELTQRKLAQAPGAPLGPRFARQWRLDRSELLWDPHAPEASQRTWALLRNRDKSLIELRRIGGDGLAIQQAEDALLHPSSLRPPNELRTLIQRGLTLAGECWPMIAHEQLAAVPVLGGLVCVGLGPERYGGRRLWELAVPAWTSFPRDFAQRSAAGPLGVYFTPRRDRIALVGWSDGRIWWERDFPQVNIARLAVSGGELVVIGEDHQVWVVDAAAGDRARRLERNGIREAHVAGDVILVWEDAQAASPESLRLGGYSARDFKLLWSTPTRQLRARKVFADVDVVLAATGKDEGVQLLSARSGAALLPRALRDAGELLEIALDGEAWWLAGRAADGGDENAMLRLTVLDRKDGALRWRRDVATASPFNITQLTGHPHFVPVLIESASERERAREQRRPPPRIVMVEKQTGTVLEPRSLAEEYRGFESPGDAFLLVTPTRLVVQIAGNVLGFGSSATETTP